MSGDPLAETDGSGNTTAEYIFFGGKRTAMLPWSGTPPVAGNPSYYVEDMLGTSRVITTNTGVVCYDADFYPYGGERVITSSSGNHYKFTSKERDTETGNDDFGARYYSNRFGRWLSADWSSVPEPVPYANLSNPQTLNLYAMVSDNPETFADLDGHCCWQEVKDFGIGVLKGAVLSTVPGGPVFFDTYGLIITGNMRNQAPPILNPPSNGAQAAGAVVGIIATYTAISVVASGPEAIEAESAILPSELVITDDAIVVRGGIGEIPNGTFSGSVGSTEAAAGMGIKNNQMRVSTAGEIRAEGGTVEYAPEPQYPGGPMNIRHVNVNGGQETFSQPKPNPAPKNLRPQSPPKQEVGPKEIDRNLLNGHSGDE